MLKKAKIKLKYKILNLLVLLVLLVSIATIATAATYYIGYFIINVVLQFPINVS